MIGILPKCSLSTLSLLPGLCSYKIDALNLVNYLDFYKF